MTVCRASDASLFEGARGRVVRIGVESGSTTSSMAGRLSELIDDMLDMVDNCEVEDDVLDTV